MRGAAPPCSRRMRPSTSLARSGPGGRRAIAAMLAASVALTACVGTKTHVTGNVIAGGPIIQTGVQVRFERQGEVVASTTVQPPAESFDLWLLPGSYEVVVSNLGGGCPRTTVIVQGPTTKLAIERNFGV